MKRPLLHIYFTYINYYVHGTVTAIINQLLILLENEVKSSTSSAWNGY
jgi:hypothetical protein